MTTAAATYVPEWPPDQQKAVTALDMYRWADHTPIPVRAKSVLVSLIDNAWNGTWKCFDTTSLGVLAKRQGVSRRHVRRQLRVLEALGVLKTTPRAWQTWSYEVVPRALFDLAQQARAAVYALLERVGSSVWAVVDLARDQLGRFLGGGQPELVREPSRPVVPVARAPKASAEVVTPAPSPSPAASALSPQLAEQVVHEVMGDAFDEFCLTERSVAKLWSFRKGLGLQIWREDWTAIASALRSCSDIEWELLRQDRSKHPLSSPSAFTKRARKAREWTTRQARLHQVPGATPHPPSAPEPRAGPPAEIRVRLPILAGGSPPSISVGDDLAKAWAERCMPELARLTSEDEARIWLGQAEPVRVDGGSLVLRVPSGYHAGWIEENYVEALEQAVAALA